MDHFDNGMLFEEGFGRAMIASERRDGHMKRLPPSSFGFYGGAVPTVVGLTLSVLQVIAKEGSLTVERNRRPLAMIGSADVHSQISSLITRGLVRSEEVSPTQRILAITDLGRTSLVASA